MRSEIVAATTFFPEGGAPARLPQSLSGGLQMPEYGGHITLIEVNAATVFPTGRERNTLSRYNYSRFVVAEDVPSNAVQRALCLQAFPRCCSFARHCLAQRKSKNELLAFRVARTAHTRLTVRLE